MPTLPTLSLSDDEKALIRRLEALAHNQRGTMELASAYYHGEQIINDLGIAIPKEIYDKLRTLVGWPRIAVDPYVERLLPDGFRLAGATDADSGLRDLWDANGLDAEFPMATTDALMKGRAFWTVGTGDEAGDPPRICAESPLNMSVLWELNGRRPRVALQRYKTDDAFMAVLYLPDRTIYLAADGDSQTWEVTNRDDHNFGHVPVVRMAHTPETSARDGASAITPELQSIVDGACRKLLGLEVASELYSVPGKVILGAAESDFQGADGKPKKAWETYITKILALERDEDGNLPEIHQFTPYDPSVFTKIIEMYASQASGILAANPQDLGLYTQGNPTSAEAGAVVEARRDRRAKRYASVYGVALMDVMKLAKRFENNGELPDEFRRMAVDWNPVELATPGVTSDAITKQIAAGAIPATSDVTLKRLGYTAVERAQLAKDRGPAEAQAALTEIRATLLKNAASAANKPAPEQKPVTPNVRTDG
jgi:hypothetical protein